MSQVYLSPETLSYHRELTIARTGLQRLIPSFPKDCCQLTARLVQRTLGLEERAGHHKVNGRIPKESILHAWNLDEKRGLYVDLTLNQFFPDAPEIAVLPAEDTILCTDEYLSGLRGIGSYTDTDLLEGKDLLGVNGIRTFEDLIREIYGIRNPRFIEKIVETPSFQFR